MSARPPNILERFTRWFLNLDSPSPRVDRVYEQEFADRSAVRIQLSTWRPRFRAEFSEPPSSLTRSEYLDFRTACLADFAKRTGHVISQLELENERARPLPSVSRFEREDWRENLTNRKI